MNRPPAALAREATPRRDRTAARWLLALAAVAATSPAAAALLARDLDGDWRTAEAYYDTVLDLTWLADANYAFRTGVDDDGAMSWVDAQAWLATLSVHGVTGWRLPTLSPVNGTSFRYGTRFDGTSDRGYNITSPRNELAHLFYVTLGNQGRFDTTGKQRPGQAGAQWGVVNTGPFRDLDAFPFPTFWQGVDYAPTPGAAWFFYAYNGNQSMADKSLPMGVWPVRAGDFAAPVPEPGTWALWAGGLVAVGAIAGRRARRPVAG